jgi:GNAT superfamily N-acetyltransferase
MFEYLSYVLCFGILIVFLIYIYIRVKYGFWVMQPVFHVYDFGYMLNPPGIIQDSLPEKNKYTNFKDIDTLVFSELTSIQKTRFTNLIKTNYLQNKDNIFFPRFENIMPYFIGHNDKSFISFFYKDEYMLDLKKGNMITDRHIIGTMTSRPLNVSITNDGKNKNVKIRVYYVDYLCVDKLHRKQGIAPQLIQTHHYNQRHLNKNIVISLFKREDELTGIVPLCVYSTYGFHVEKWTKPLELSGEYKLLEINGTNFRFVHDFIRENNNKFDITINADIANILELIKTKNIFVYAILCDEKIQCCYFYRKSCVQIEKGLEVLSCFASICDCEEDVFIQGFKISFWKIAAENFFGFCAIENLSDNNIIINNIILKTRPLIVSPTAYFFYNFAYPTFKPEKVLIIN